MCESRMLKSGARIGKLETAWSERKDAVGTEEGYAGEKVYFKQKIPIPFCFTCS